MIDWQEEWWSVALVDSKTLRACIFAVCAERLCLTGRLLRPARKAP